MQNQIKIDRIKYNSYLRKYMLIFIIELVVSPMILIFLLEQFDNFDFIESNYLSFTIAVPVLGFFAFLVFIAKIRSIPESINFKNNCILVTIPKFLFYQENRFEIIYKDILNIDIFRKFSLINNFKNSSKLVIRFKKLNKYNIQEGTQIVSIPYEVLNEMEWNNVNEILSMKHENL